ncbi:MAG: hypothetical protein ACK5XN_01605 [Bacteroidota bacterium]|jgi:hypothetical protein
MKLVITFIFMAFSSLGFAQDAHDHMMRLEKMVQTGAITHEAATYEKIRLTTEREGLKKERHEAQRSLASVNPSLKPLKINRVKFPAIELWLD